MTSTDRQIMPTAALAELRSAVVGRRRGGTATSDRLYRVYVTTLLGGVGFYAAIGVVDGVAVSASTVESIATNGPSVLALLASIAVVAGLRSGLQGGPFALEPTDVHHVMLSPHSRADALALPSRKLFVASAGIAIVVGAAVGELASRQLPGRQGTWVIGGAACATAIALTSIGAALIAAAVATTARRRWVQLAAIALPGWAAADVVNGWRSAPTQPIGSIGFLASDADPLAIVGIVTAVVVAFTGWALRGRLTLELAHRRSRLIALVRFAIAQQDLRSLLLLRRQLAFEHPRSRPWVRLGQMRPIHDRWPGFVRGLRSYARWPLSRIARTTALAVGAGVALGNVWAGTPALLAAVAVALYAAALEVVEPIGQEFDHPSIVENTPAPLGPLLGQQIAAALVPMTALWLVVAAVTGLTAGSVEAGAAASVAAGPASLAAVAAAGISIKRIDSPSMLVSPEIEGPRLLYRLLWPPALTMAGALPVFTAHAAFERDGLWLPSAVNTAGIVAVVGAAVAGWIRFRDQFLGAAEAAQGSTSRPAL